MNDNYQPITVSVLESFEGKDPDDGATIVCAKSKYLVADQANNKASPVVGDKRWVYVNYLTNANNWNDLMSNWQIKLN